MANIIDGAIIASQCDGAVIVIESGAISYRLVQKAVSYTHLDVYKRQTLLGEGVIVDKLLKMAAKDGTSTIVGICYSGGTVSYTHLDVYKRQDSACSLSGTDKSSRIRVVLFSRTSQWTM